MRGSGVVQSLKSLLHPQLPLSPKESQRLLTALTSSFRQKLDEAHPGQIPEENTRPKRETGQAQGLGRNGLHSSSMALADRHLASVLTNPLLSNNAASEGATLNLDTAKREIENNPDKDPIKILEEYHEKGAAAIPIANLCLKAFRRTLLPLSGETRQRRVRSAKAGVRVLHWLWHTELFRSDEFVDDRRLMSSLVKMISEEGQEQFLWDWIKLDQKSSGRTGLDPYWAQQWAYRWKAYILRLLVLRTNNSDDKLNQHFDTFFKAVEVSEEVRQQSTTNCIPLVPATRAISNYIFGHRDERESWDVRRYDRFIESMDYVFDNPRDVQWRQYMPALLQLTHPHTPTPIPMLKVLKQVLTGPPGKSGFVRAYFEQRISQSDVRLKRYNVLMFTAQLLARRGHNDDKEWILTEARRIFPEFKQRMEDDLTKSFRDDTEDTFTRRFRPQDPFQLLLGPLSNPRIA